MLKLKISLLITLFLTPLSQLYAPKFTEQELIGFLKTTEEQTLTLANKLSWYKYASKAIAEHLKLKKKTPTDLIRKRVFKIPEKEMALVSEHIKKVSNSPGNNTDLKTELVHIQKMLVALAMLSATNEAENPKAAAQCKRTIHLVINPITYEILYEKLRKLDIFIIAANGSNNWHTLLEIDQIIRKEVEKSQDFTVLDLYIWWIKFFMKAIPVIDQNPTKETIIYELLQRNISSVTPTIEPDFTINQTINQTCQILFCRVNRRKEEEISMKECVTKIATLYQAVEQYLNLEINLEDLECFLLKKKREWMIR